MGEKSVFFRAGCQIPVGKCVFDFRNEKPLLYEDKTIHYDDGCRDADGGHGLVQQGGRQLAGDVSFRCQWCLAGSLFGE